MKKDIRGNDSRKGVSRVNRNDTGATNRTKRKLSPAKIANRQIQFEKELLEKINGWGNQGALCTGIACVSIATVIKNDVCEFECFSFPEALTTIFRHVPYNKRYSAMLTVFGNGRVKSSDVDNVEVPFYSKLENCQILDINCQLFIKILKNDNYEPSKSFFDNAKRHFEASKRVMREKAKAQDFNC